jgi:hypothetical protein
LALKEYASDLQTFLGNKSIEVEVEKQEKFVESLSEDGSLKQPNVPSLFRITSFCLELLSVNNILPLGQIAHPLLLFDISFGILIFEYKVSLLILIPSVQKELLKLLAGVME